MFPNPTLPNLTSPAFTAKIGLAVEEYHADRVTLGPSRDAVAVGDAGSWAQLVRAVGSDCFSFLSSFLPDDATGPTGDLRRGLDKWVDKFERKTAANPAWLTKSMQNRESRP